jgi:hypothetical protein
MHTDGASRIDTIHVPSFQGRRKDENLMMWSKDIYQQTAESETKQVFEIARKNNECILVIFASTLWLLLLITQTRCCTVVPSKLHSFII